MSLDGGWMSLDGEESGACCVYLKGNVAEDCGIRKGFWTGNIHFEGNGHLLNVGVRTSTGLGKLSIVLGINSIEQDPRPATARSALFYLFVQVRACL
jgi:hypothetical protein